MARILFYPLLFCLLAFSYGETVKRGFIGVKTGYYPRDIYKPQENLTLIFYDNFNDNSLNACWKSFGTAEFAENGRSLKTQMKTLKQSALSGSIVCDQILDFSKVPVRVTVEQTIPNRNTSISSAIFLAPVSARFDNNGLPSEYIRFLKRSQIEILETKKGDRTTLLWGRNEEIRPGEPVTYAMQIDRKNIILLVNGKKIFGGEHFFTGSTGVKAGIWVATKGVSFAGGNMVYDNFTLESGFGKIEEPDTVLEESGPKPPAKSRETSDSILPPPPSVPLAPGEVREMEEKPAAPPAADSSKTTQ